MFLQSQDFYAIAKAEIGIPVKQKIFNFQEEAQRNARKNRIHNLSSLGFTNPQTHYSIQNKHFALRPMLPSKKLFDQPRFFMSLERKKVRIIDGLKNVTKFQQKSSTSASLRGKKLKGNQVQQSKKESSTSSKSNIYHQKILTSKAKAVKNPFLNYNMQYLIKRKLMTPGPKISHQTMSLNGQAHTQQI